MAKATRRANRRRNARYSASHHGGMVSMESVRGNLTRAREELIAQRNALDEQLTAVDNALCAMGTRPAAHAARRGPAAAPVGRRGGRGAGPGRRAGSLKEHIAGVLSSSGGPMAVKDITEGVRRGGYQTRNKTLAKSVGIALTQMPEVQKVGRGLFQMK